jgi:hypothetical protein
MRQTIVVAVTTALITAIVAVWGTTVIVANTQDGADAVLTSSDQMQLTQAIRDAISRVDEKAGSVD